MHDPSLTTIMTIRRRTQVNTLTNIEVCPTLLYSTVRHWYGTVLVLVWYSTVRYGTVRYGMVQYGTIRYGTALYSTYRYSTVQCRYSTVPYRTLPPPLPPRPGPSCNPGATPTPALSPDKWLVRKRMGVQVTTPSCNLNRKRTHEHRRHKRKRERTLMISAISGR